jgi:hypothetical protein
VHISENAKNGLRIEKGAHISEFGPKMKYIAENNDSVVSIIRTYRYLKYVDF